MNKIEAYFDSEVGGWMVRGTRRPNNRIFQDRASAERYAQKAQNARQKIIDNYRNLELSYDDIYGISITASDMPNSPIYGEKNEGTNEGNGFKTAFEDIWEDTSAPRTLGYLVDKAKSDSDVLAFLKQVRITYGEQIDLVLLEDLKDEAKIFSTIRGALTTLLKEYL